MRFATGVVIGVLCSSTFAAQPTAIPTPELGMVADTFGMVFVFDTDPRSVLGAIHVGPGGIAGDCVISPDGRRGFVTDSNRHVWVVDLTSIPPQLAQGTNPIAISGLGVDLASTADGRFLVVCDSGFVNLVSVIDVAGRVESSTFNVGASCNSVDVCSDGSVLVASSGAEFVRRLVIDQTGHLSNTGETLFVVEPGNVYCSPDGRAGVAMSHNGQLRSFRIPGLMPVSTRSRSAYGASGAMAKDGTRFYGRSFDGIDAFDFDQATAELGAAPAFSVSVGSAGFYNFGGADQLALDLDGTTLYTPAQYQLGVNDAGTGAPLPALLMPDLLTSGGICFGPQNQSGCQVEECDDANPCTDDVCGDTGCLHVPDNSNSCGTADNCVETHVCSAGTCVSSGPGDCNAACPPGFSFTGGVCQKSYDIDASLLDHLNDSCDGSGTNRFHCETAPYGFHWTDVSGGGVGRVSGLDLRLVTGVNCAGGQSEVRFNGVPIDRVDPAVDCNCSPVHTLFRSFPDSAPYQKDGLNAISIIPTGSCEGLSASPILDGLFARVIVSYARQDPNCSTGVCNATTGNCDYTVQDCDDGNPCTEDACDPQGDCVHVPAAEFTPCDDYNVCNGNEWCNPDGGCYSHSPPACFSDFDPCTRDFCDPVSGCAYEPIDCSDNNPCTDDACSPEMGCAHAINANPCDDGNACTSGDLCVLGVCNSGTTITAPPETHGVTAAANKATYGWSAVTSATRYDVVRGGTGALPVGPGGGDEVCFDNLSGPTLTDLTVPATGSGFWYLSRGENSCGIGTYGTRSDGSTRVTGTCP